MTDLTDTGRYIHGTEAEEQQRLSRLNELLNRRSLVELGLRPGMRVLDIGSGLGQLTRAIARAVAPGGCVVGIERDPEQLAEAGRQARDANEAELVEFRRGSAPDLPLVDDEWGSFDLVHTRFVLEHVPEPLAVVKAMFRASRPGGRIVLEDDDHDLLRLWPPLPELDPAWQAYIRTYEALGNDPYVGRRLVELLRVAGAGDTRAEMLFFGSCATDPNLPLLIDNFTGLLTGARDEILRTGDIDAPTLELALTALQNWGRRPDAAFWYATCWAMGRKPGESKAAMGPIESEAIEVPAPGGEGRLTGARFLADSARDLNSTLRLDEVFLKISARVHQLLDYHLFCILLWNEELEALEFSYSLRYGEHIEQEGRFPLGYGLGGSAAQLRRAIRVDDVALDPRYVRVRHTEVEVRSELAVPLIVKDRLIGVLDFESTEYAAFTAEHEEVLTTLAAYIAIALENARLYEDVRSREKRHEEDLATARVIQNSLLPAAALDFGDLKVAGACHPAAELSGDFYDVIPYSDGRLAIAVGDVAGKGTGAAMYGAMAVGALRGEALRQGDSPGQMFAFLNRHLAALEIPRRFLALSYAVWDPENRTLEIGNAGLPLPIRLRSGVAEELEVSGLPLGQPLESDHHCLTLKVEPGDVYLFCSDGLTEARNADGECYDAQRIEAWLAACAACLPAEIVAGLIRESLSFSAGGTGEEDDRTLLVLGF